MADDLLVSGFRVAGPFATDFFVATFLAFFIEPPWARKPRRSRRGRSAQYVVNNVYARSRPQDNRDDPARYRVRRAPPDEALSAPAPRLPYSSQTCPACGVVDAASRQGDRFRCVACGHEAHADLDATRVLPSRGNLGDAGRGGFRAVGGPAKRQLRVVRRGHSTVQVPGLLKRPGLQSG
ncbi:MAG: hypothetical protein DME09_00500 [Candidatus Rokuibacteriota bacterium]|nr:MAG: hypothetical protein DME09_00500 [Candidatus Rokubacteria bacterium]